MVEALRGGRSQRIRRGYIERGMLEGLVLVAGKGRGKKKKRKEKKGFFLVVESRDGMT